MKISALISDLADNPIVRAYPILRVLERRYEIDVVGCCFGEHVFQAYSKDFDFKVIEGCYYPQFIRRFKEIYKHIEGDIIFAFKPRPTSYLIGLACSALKRIPLVLDIEDWELAPYSIQKEQLSKSVFFERYILHGWKMPNDYKYLHLSEKLVPLARATFVASNFLKGKYGGTKLYHGVDTEVFSPKGLDKQHLRGKWRVPTDKKIVLFAGTPRPHKGLDDLIRALNIIDPDCKVHLLLVGGRIEGSIDGELYEMSKKRTIYLGYQPHGLMPDILYLSDLVVLPQKDSPISRAQVPAKVFEAMAMAKPIVSTALSDLPEILDDCGIIVEPGDIDALAKGIKFILENSATSCAMGEKARRKCVESYSYEAMGRILFPLFRQFEKKYTS